MARRTKIVATLGPATDNPDVLQALLSAGVDVARINFSHGTSAELSARIHNLRTAARTLKRAVAVLADLPGPKLRNTLTEPRILIPGEEVAFSLDVRPHQTGDITITEPELLTDVRPGHRILLDDGRLTLTAQTVREGTLIARVAKGGTLNPRKGINLPDTPLSIAAVTPRDLAALAVACSAGVDWLALSFVRGPDAAEALRRAAEAHGYRGPIMAKIERPEAVTQIDALCEAFDGVMVARGDLGVEMPLESVPAAQKLVIAAARRAGKPVITATEMLESMTKNPRPTRAEVNDVANAIFDGTDAVMLSGETAIGDHPVEAVACMARIAVQAEAHMQSHEWTEMPVPHGEIDDPLAQAACELALETRAQAIVTPTLSGRTALRLARHRPRAAIVAPAPDEIIQRRMAVVWGISPVPMTPLVAGSDRLETSVFDAYRAGAVCTGDRVIVLAGHPIEGGKRFPTLRIVRVGEGGTSLEP